jgi:Ca2+-binding EF-hand superfamily protein
LLVDLGQLEIALATYSALVEGFQEFDSSGDGVLDAQEFGRVLADLYQGEPEEGEPELVSILQLK